MQPPSCPHPYVIYQHPTVPNQSLTLEEACQHGDANLLRSSTYNRVLGSILRICCPRAAGYESLLIYVVKEALWISHFRKICD